MAIDAIPTEFGPLWYIVIADIILAIAVIWFQLRSNDKRMLRQDGAVERLLKQFEKVTEAQMEQMKNSTSIYSKHIEQCQAELGNQGRAMRMTAKSLKRLTEHNEAASAAFGSKLESVHRQVYQIHNHLELDTRHGHIDG